MLNNNIKILLVSFVHHIELQNFLNTPRKSKTHKKSQNVIIERMTNLCLRPCLIDWSICFDLNNSMHIRQLD